MRQGSLFIAAIGFFASVLQAEVIYRTPLSEAGQSGICLQGDRLFLTVHKMLEGPLKGGFYFNGDIVGQCFNKETGKLLWEVELPGTWAGRVLESWHDSTSLLPVADDEHVVFHNLNGMLACCTHDGELIWKRTWQAPDPDIKNCRMFLHGGQLLVALPSEKIAVKASKKHPELPFYLVHSIDLKTGEDNWVSPTLLTHANPAWPVVHGDQLFWQGGAGLLYLIDLKKPFSPDAISWRSIENGETGGSWTFGEPAIDDSSIYLRSQRELVRLAR